MKTAGTLVLLVEDCEQTRRLYERVLVEGGYRVAVAADGLEGVRKAESLAPDLIVTDLDMPVLDGLEAVARIRRSERTRTTPIVVLTGTAFRRCMLRAYEVGCNAFLVKPCRPRELLDVIAQCLLAPRALSTRQPLTGTG